MLLIPQTRPCAQLNLTNHKVFRGLERKESIWENMGLNWVTEFQSEEFALGTTRYLGEETEAPQPPPHLPPKKWIRVWSRITLNSLLFGW